MGDIMREIILHFFIRTLAKQGPDEIPEYESENEECGGRTGKYACHLPECASAKRFNQQAVEAAVGRVVLILKNEGSIRGCIAWGGQDGETV